MKNYHILLLALLFFVGCGITKKRLNAYEAIEQLKEGVLLVQLVTYKNTIQRLYEQGNIEKGNAYKERERKENRLLMTYFNEFFDFCPVYFFHPHELDKIRNGQLSLAFRDENLELDPQIDLTGTPYLIAQFGYPDINEPFVGGKDIFIKDPDFNQMKKPFPYQAKDINLYLGDKSQNPLNLQSLNNKLQNFYYKSRKYRLKQQVKNLEISE